MSRDELIAAVLAEVRGHHESQPVSSRVIAYEVNRSATPRPAYTSNFVRRVSICLASLARSGLVRVAQRIPHGGRKLPTCMWSACNLTPSWERES